MKLLFTAKCLELLERKRRLIDKLERGEYNAQDWYNLIAELQGAQMHDSVTAMREKLSAARGEVYPVSYR